MLNTTVGRSYSNSFVTLEEANYIIANDLPYDRAEWSALTDSEKECRLRLAANVMGFLPLKGRKPFEDQALCFPRDVQTNILQIPNCVKRAQVAVAYIVVHKHIANLQSVSQLDPEGRLSGVSLGGVLRLSFSGNSAENVGVLQYLANSAYSIIYIELSKYLSIFRGSSICDLAEVVWHTLSSTTTTSSSSTTSSSTTTTTL